MGLGATLPNHIPACRSEFDPKLVWAQNLYEHKLFLGPKTFLTHTKNLFRTKLFSDLKFFQNFLDLNFFQTKNFLDSLIWYASKKHFL